MIKIRYILLSAILAVTTGLLSGCKFALLDPKGMIAADEKQIMMTSLLLMLVVVVPVIILTFIFAWRYRASNVRATYSPDWAHSTLIEILIWSVPGVIVVLLGIITWTSSHRLDPYKPLTINADKTLTIQAIALEWKWLFIYPEQKIATVNFVEFPAGVPVKFEITAEGPMNSFQIPQLAGQIYAMAGMQTKLHVIAQEAGEYQGISANFSGDGFSDMTFIARATSQQDFAAWVSKVKQAPATLTMTAYNTLVTPSEREPVRYFAFADKDIFDTVVMKSMMPMPMPMKTMATVSNQKTAVSLKK